SFRTKDGFRMDLLAHEPQITSPVALAYDEDGRAYVLEMRDYPYTDKANDKPFAESTRDRPLGRIRLLRDTKGDGVFDESVIFADNLSWPTGIACWKGGVFVAATPDIWYLKEQPFQHGMLFHIPGVGDGLHPLSRSSARQGCCSLRHPTSPIPLHGSWLSRLSRDFPYR